MEIAFGLIELILVAVAFVLWWTEPPQPVTTWSGERWYAAGTTGVHWHKVSRGVLFLVGTTVVPSIWFLVQWYVYPPPSGKLDAFMYDQKLWSNIWASVGVVLGVLFGIKKR